MRRTALIDLLAVALLGLASPAQAFVVDANNGPGTDFTSLTAAFASLPDGATVTVRAGTYSATFPFPTLVGKGVTILGEPGAQVWGIGFSGQSAGQRVVVKGLRFGSTGGLLQFGGVMLDSCGGPVLLEDCTTDTQAGLSVVQCPQVSVVRCEFRHAQWFNTNRFDHSTVVCVDTQLSGSAATVGLGLTSGTTQLVRGLVEGGSVAGLNTGKFGIEMNGGLLRLLGDGVVVGGTGYTGQAAAISGSGTVRKSPAFVLGGSAIPFVPIDEGWTTGTVAPVGGVATGRLHGSANLYGGLVLGTIVSPAALPGIAGTAWVDAWGFAAVGPLGAPLACSVTVPDLPALRGMAFGWQGVTASATAGLVMTNPAWLCVE